MTIENYRRLCRELLQRCKADGGGIGPHARKDRCGLSDRS
jgi:hypothetical protein